MREHERFLRARAAFADAVLGLLVAENDAAVTAAERNLLTVAREVRPTLAKLVGEADVADFALAAEPIVRLPRCDLWQQRAGVRR